MPLYHFDTNTADVTNISIALFTYCSFVRHSYSYTICLIDTDSNYRSNISQTMLSTHCIKHLGYKIVNSRFIIIYHYSKFIALQQPAPITSTQPIHYQPEQQQPTFREFPADDPHQQPIAVHIEQQTPPAPSRSSEIRPQIRGAAPLADESGTNVDELVEAMNGFSTTSAHVPGGYSNGERHNKSMDNVLDNSYTMPAHSSYDDYHNR